MVGFRNENAPQGAFIPYHIYRSRTTLLPAIFEAIDTLEVRGIARLKRKRRDGLSAARTGPIAGEGLALPALGTRWRARPALLCMAIATEKTGGALRLKWKRGDRAAAFRTGPISLKHMYEIMSAYYTPSRPSHHLRSGSSELYRSVQRTGAAIIGVVRSNARSEKAASSPSRVQIDGYAWTPSGRS